MKRLNIIKVSKDIHPIYFRQDDGSFIQEDSYSITIGITYPNGDVQTRSIGEMTKEELSTIKEEIEKILNS